MTLEKKIWIHVEKSKKMEEISGEYLDIGDHIGNCVEKMNCPWSKVVFLRPDTS
jgi:hypothetical protein